ncbi:MAG: hypothetical protein IPN17_24875 [Deltaproteobacteria bacterium]|nr:hypothetical protein [Deltaproteobacteria bacterium]
MGGASATLLRHQGGRVERFAAPGSARATVFGLWGARPDDVYAVGSTAGRNGFVWHFDGTSWRDTALPSSLPDVNATQDGPAFFKVWGAAPTTVWVVGELGVALHGRAGAFTPFDTGTTRRLFTVHGDAQRTFLVGGDAQGVLQESSGAAAAFAGRAPDDAQLLQGVCSSGDATWAVGQGCRVFQRVGTAWREEDHGLRLTAQSLHAVWIDPGGGVWAVGGNVLSTSLDAGVIAHYGAAVAAVASPAGRDAGADGGDASTPVTCPEGAIDPAPAGSIARRWNEQILNAIRRDVPRPGVHARNLFHLSVAMWDAWAAYDATADGYVSTARSTATDPAAARREAISYAAHRVLTQRYARASGGALDRVLRDAFPAPPRLRSGGHRHRGRLPPQRGQPHRPRGDRRHPRRRRQRAQRLRRHHGLRVPQPRALGGQPGHGAHRPVALAAARPRHGDHPERHRARLGAAAVHRRQLGPGAPLRAAPPRADGAAYFPPRGAERDAARDGPVDGGRGSAASGSSTPRPATRSTRRRGRWATTPRRRRRAGPPDEPRDGRALRASARLPATSAACSPSSGADGPHSGDPPGHWNVLANQGPDSPGFARRWHGAGPDARPARVGRPGVLRAQRRDARRRHRRVGAKRRVTQLAPDLLIRWMATWAVERPAAPGITRTASRWCRGPSSR